MLRRVSEVSLVHAHPATLAAPRQMISGPLLAGLSGAWLLVSTALLAHEKTGLLTSDLCSGLLVIVLSSWWVRTTRAAPRWLIAGVGCWLLLAPLLFWAPRISLCLNDFVTGTLLITAATIIPTVQSTDDGSAIPPEWNYNPSDWSQRIPISLLALAGFTMSGYLAAVQLGYTDRAWDPLFGDGTERVLTSDISRWFPVSDAGLGAVSYLLEALTGFIGDRRRWRTMPWVVLLFGLMIIPTGVVSIVLVVLQPIGVGSWCTLCLATAAVMLLMVSPALDEVIATCQVLRRSQRRGERWWMAIFQGVDERAAPLTTPASPTSTTGIRPWHLVLAAMAGGWLMGAPYVTGTVGTIAGHSDHLAGALAVTVAVIASDSVARVLRWLLLPVGLWVVLSAWWLPGVTSGSAWNAVAIGSLLVVCGLVRGRITGHFGTWNRLLR